MKGIRFKILRSFLTVSLAALLLTITMFEVIMWQVRRHIDESSELIGQESANSSEQLLINQALDNAVLLASERAQSVNRQLSALATQLWAISGYIDNLYENPDSFKPHSPKTMKDIVAEGNGKNMSLQYALCPGVTYEDVKYELELQGNLVHLLGTVHQTYPTITSFYTATDSGVNIGFDDNAYEKSQLIDLYYESRDSAWYVGAKDKNGLYVSETYADSFGRGLTITMSAPFYKEGKFIGVVGVDLLIEQMNEDILSMKLGDNGYAMLFSANGRVISAAGLTDENSENLGHFLGSNHAAIIDAMKRSPNGVMQSTIDRADVYVLYNAIELTGWSFAVVLPVADIIAPARQSTGIIQSIIANAKDDMNGFMLVTSLLLLLMFGIVVAAIVPITLNVAKKITQPITALTEEVKQIGEGNLDYRSGIFTGDEVETLSLSFEQMTKSLRDHMVSLAKATADKERIATELNVATQIQASMLPSIFPPFPERSEFAIIASMKPAKEVGGDFYDFFLVDDTHLAIVIADVSGKGVPAALFMVITKTLIKNHTQAGESPMRVFCEVNRQLCESNEAGMFVTAWMGILDFSTGEFVFANAGHNLPLIKRAEGGFEWLASSPCFVLAGMEDIEYEQNTTTLKKGDMLFLYTDGVTEANNDEMELFGDDRLISLLNSDIAMGIPVTQFPDFINDQITAFAGGEEQADDITMLVLEINELLSGTES